MRKLTLAIVMALVMIIPLPSAAADHCPTITGRANLDFGAGIGWSRLVVDGQAMRVPFVPTGFVETGPGTADIYFDWYFPNGVVSVVEHSRSTGIGGPFGHFGSTVEVLSGGEGEWRWAGTVDYAHSRARIESISGVLCLD